MVFEHFTLFCKWCVPIVRQKWLKLYVIESTQEHFNEIIYSFNIFFSCCCEDKIEGGGGADDETGPM